MAGGGASIAKEKFRSKRENGWISVLGWQGRGAAGGSADATCMPAEGRQDLWAEGCGHVEKFSSSCLGFSAKQEVHSLAENEKLEEVEI